MLRLASLAALSLAFIQPAAADCALNGLTAKVITKTGAELPADGGVLVFAAMEQNGKLETGDAAIQKSWRFKGSDAEPKFDSIAPGLAVIRLAKDASGRPRGGELVDGKTSLVVVKSTDTKRPALPAPQVKSIVAEDRVSRRVSGRIAVMLGAQPAGVVALVLADGKGKPRSFGLIGALAAPGGGMPAGPDMIYAFSRHECQALPNGTVQSKAGEVVTVFFVDDAGRVSPPSKPFKIIAKQAP